MGETVITGLQQVCDRTFFAEYLADSLSQVVTVQECWNSSPYIEDYIYQAVEVAHKLKGCSALYGHPELGLTAMHTEGILKMNGHTELAKSSLTRLVNHIREICETDIVVTSLEPPSEAVSQLPTVVIVHQDNHVHNHLSSWFSEKAIIKSMPSLDVAKRYLEENPAAIIICQYTPDELDGLEMLRVRHADWNLPSASFILMLDETSSARDAADAMSISGNHSMIGQSADLKRLIAELTGIIGSDRQRILIIDDDEPVRTVLKNTFSNAGINADIAKDGVEALEYLKTKTPDLIILDRMMPRMNGASTLYEIQALADLCETPIIMLTAMNAPGAAASWLSRGVADFIPKPFDPSEVVMRAQRHLSQRRATAQ